MNKQEQLAVTEYLHLYLGCDMMTSFCGHKTIKKLSAVIGNKAIYDCADADEVDMAASWDMNYTDEPDRPILRPLSDMTEEEAQVLFRMYWGRDYEEDWSGDTGSAYFKPRRINPTKEHTMRIIEGLDYQTGDFITVVKIVPRLLTLGFDLFGLIEAGLAIDATTINNQSLNQ
jgi:hypothetical protein